MFERCGKLLTPTKSQKTIMIFSLEIDKGNLTVVKVDEDVNEL